MDFQKFRNFNWIETDSKDQNLNLTRTKRFHFIPFSFTEDFGEKYTETL